MASLFDMMTPAPAGISGVKEIVSRIDKMKFGKYIKPDYLEKYQPEVKNQPTLKPLVVKPQLLTNTTAADVEEIVSPSPRTTLGDYEMCESDESSGECFSQDDNTSTDELPEMLDEIIKPKDAKQPKQPKQPRAKNKAHDISKLFYHLSKAFEIIGDLNGLNERDA